MSSTVNMGAIADSSSHLLIKNKNSMAYKNQNIHGTVYELTISALIPSADRSISQVTDYLAAL